MKAYRRDDGTEVKYGDRVHDSLGDSYLFQGVARDATPGFPGRIQTPQGERTPGTFGLVIR